MTTCFETTGGGVIATDVLYCTNTGGVLTQGRGCFGVSPGFIID